MGRALVLAFLTVGSVCLAAPSAAQSPRVARWAPSDVARRAAQNAPHVRAAEMGVMVAESHGEHANMPVVRNPILGLRALFGFPDESAATYAVSIGIPFDLTSRQSLRTSEAELLVDEAEGRADLARLQAWRDGLAAGAQVAAGQDALRVAEERLTLAETLLSSVQRRLDSASATALDLALVEQEVATAAANVESRRRQLEAARDVLRDVLDLEPNAPVAMAPLADARMPEGLSLAAVIARARANRLEPRIHRLSARRFRTTANRFFAESISPLVLSAEYELQSNSQRNSSLGVGAFMELPLFWTAQGDRAVAQSEATASDLGAEQAARAVEREAAAAWRALDGALAEFATLDERALPASHRALSLTEELLAAGSVDVLRVLLARRSLFELQERRVDLTLAAWLARAELERAMGGSDR